MIDGEIHRDICLRELVGHRPLSNDVLVKFVCIAMDSCCAFQERLNLEQEPGCVQEMITAMEQILVIVWAIIVHLIKRTDNSFEGEQSEFLKQSKEMVKSTLANTLLGEFFQRCPGVSAPFFGYESPLIHTLYRAKYKARSCLLLTVKIIRYNFKFMKMVIDSHWHVNSTDVQGNTILHIILSEVLLDIDVLQRFNFSPAYTQELSDTTVNIVQLLLDNGSYPHAKNKQGKYPGEGLLDIELKSYFNPHNLITRFNHLLEKYDCTFTLKYLTAKKIVDSKIAYEKHLPKSLVRFLDLH